MATEADKTNDGVILTALLLGGAAMLAGSAALVALAKGEIQETAEELQGFTDHSSLKKLRESQRAALAGAKLPLAKAEAMTLAAIKANALMASPDTAPQTAPAEPKPVAPSAVPSASALPTGSASAGSAAAAPSTAPKGAH